MLRNKSLLNFLAIALMVFMIAITAIFIYSSLLLKDKITFRVVQQTELVSELITRSSVDLMGSGHNAESYSRVLAYGNHVGIEGIGLYTLDGSEAFSGTGPAREGETELMRKLHPEERESFARAIETSNSTGYFNHEELTYSKFVPLRAEGACASCHASEGRTGETLGVLGITLSTANDFALLDYTQTLIWTLGLIVLLPVGALLVAGGIIREKSRLFSKLKESNSSLQSTYDKLDETRHYLQLILDNSRVLIITTDTSGRIVEFNQEAENLLGYTKDEMVGKNVLMLYDCPTQRSEIMNRGKPIDGEVWEVRNREVKLKSRTGRIFHVILTLSTMVDNRGKIIGTVGVGKDISEQKMLQFKLLHSEKLAGIGTLASGIAHEINNPLAAILGMAEAIKDEDDLEVIKEYTDDIIEYTENANRIVKELSVYSRSAQNEQSTTVDLAGTIRNALKMARHSALKQSVRVVDDLQGPCPVKAAPVEVQQVFVNLVVNAVQAMSGSSRDCELRLRCRREGTFAVATVSDTGPGIPSEKVGQIFDPFFTTKPVGKGTGLGLYVVYRLMTKHGGTVDVESAEGVGTTFTLKFPLVETEKTKKAV